MATILLVGSIEHGGPINWRLAPLPATVEDAPQDGELQRVIDYGAEVQELLDAREDEEWHARGLW